MFNIIVVSLLGFFVSYISIPIIISRTHKLNVLDTPEGRKMHRIPTPSFGGIAIFIGLSFSILFTFIEKNKSELLYILIAMIIVFITGLRDDRYNITPIQKLLGQVVATIIIIHNFSDARITHIPVLGLIELPTVISYGLSVFVYISLINSVNLIDGVDGLCGSMSCILFLIFGILFYVFMEERIELSYLAFGSFAATLGFLMYNISPAKIFMGDTGSLILGLFLTLLSIVCFNNLTLSPTKLNIGSPILFQLALMILPIYDTGRVIIIRIINRQSPSKADKRHIHHFLLRLGLSANKTTITLCILNLYIFALAFFLDPLGDFLGTIITLVHLIVVEFFLRMWFRKRIKRKKMKLRLQLYLCMALFFATDLAKSQQVGTLQDITWRIQVAFTSEKQTPEGMNSIIGKPMPYKEVLFNSGNITGFRYYVGSFKDRETAENFNQNQIIGNKSFPKGEIPFVVPTVGAGNNIKKVSPEEVSIILSGNDDIPKGSFTGENYENTNGLFDRSIEGEILIYVQIAASRNKMKKSEVSLRYPDPSNVIEKKHSGWYIYLIDRMYNNYRIAENAAEATLIEDAFPVFVLNGYRIDVPFSKGENVDINPNSQIKKRLLDDAKKNPSSAPKPLVTNNTQPPRTTPRTTPRINTKKTNSDLRTNTSKKASSATLPSSFSTNGTGNILPESYQFPFRQKSAFSENDFFIQFGTYSTRKTVEEIRDILGSKNDTYSIYEYKRGDNYNYFIGGPFTRSKAQSVRNSFFKIRVVSYVPRARTYKKDKIKKIILSKEDKIRLKEQQKQAQEEVTRQKSNDYSNNENINVENPAKASVNVPLPAKTLTPTTTPETPIAKSIASPSAATPSKKAITPYYFGTGSHSDENYEAEKRLKEQPVVPKTNKYIVRVFSTLTKKGETEIKRKFKSLYEKYPIYETFVRNQYEYFIGGPFENDEAEKMRELLLEMGVTSRSRTENINYYPFVEIVNGVKGNGYRPSEMLKELRTKREKVSQGKSEGSITAISSSNEGEKEKNNKKKRKKKKK